MNGTFMTNNQTKNKVELPKIGSSDQYNHLMKIIQNRVTVRKFDENYIVPDKHFEMIIEAASMLHLALILSHGILLL